MTNPKTLAALVLITIALAGVVAMLIPVEEAAVMQPLHEWRLPDKLREVSGLTVLDDNHVLTHTDESARVYAIDVTTGEVADYLVPKPAIKDDFEGIARQGDDLYLITSRGKLFHFTGAGHHSVDTGLRDVCEVEGLTIDEAQLLIACKTNYVSADEGKLLVFRFSVVERRLEPRFDVPVPGRFNLSGIALRQGRLYLLAARQRALLVLSRDGQLEHVLALKGHPQAEGITLMPDGRLVIADEGQKQGGKLTIYAPDWLSRGTRE